MIILPELHMRLGRHIHHDPRSRNHPAEAAASLKTVEHTRHVPIFNQGNKGSCTGNACAGTLSSGPYANRFNETDAIRLYSEATHLDSIAGVYPPTDTGSSGLAVMHAAKNEGLIPSYGHAFGLDHALKALVLRPGIIGIEWLTGCDNPDASGLVRYEGTVRGGHEISLIGLDVDTQLVKLANSWGTRWGVGGYFFMSFADLGKALANQGDATFAPVPA